MTTVIYNYIGRSGETLWFLAKKKVGWKILWQLDPNHCLAMLVIFAPINPIEILISKGMTTAKPVEDDILPS